MREVLGGERHHNRSQPQRDRRRCPVAGLDPFRDPADEQQEGDRRDDRAHQGQRPDERRLVLHPDLHPMGAASAVSVLAQVGVVRRRPSRIVCPAGVRGRVAGKRLGPPGVERQIGGKCERRQAGRLDRVEVATEPGLVPGLPVPGVDLRVAGRERADLGVAGQLGPAHRVHHEGPPDAKRDDREHAGARAYAHSLRHRAIVQGSGLRTATTSRRCSRKPMKEGRDQC